MLKSGFILTILMAALASFGQHSLVRLPYPVNTDLYNEICPVVAYDQSTLFFTRVGDPSCEKSLIIDGKNVFEEVDDISYNKILRRVYSELAGYPVSEPLKSGFNQDIWYTNLKDNQIEGIFHPGFPINDVLPNSICSNYGDKNGYLVINQFDPKGGIETGFSLTAKIGYEFSFPEPIFVNNFKKIGEEVNITAAIDSSMVILAMSGHDSITDVDLYFCYKFGTNAYSLPISLGPDINTQFRESTPMLSQDKKRLYFSSDRPGGYGGTDIYYSERKDWTYQSWTTPVKLFPPVNTIHDDSHPHLIGDNDHFYFTSNREGTSDIYQARLKRDVLAAQINIIIQIKSSETGELCPGELYWGDAYSGKMDGFFRSKKGACSYVFAKNKPIVFKATSRTMSSDEVILDPQELQNQGIKEYTLELIMYPDGKIQRSKKEEPKKASPQPEMLTELALKNTIYLNNIYFERAKPTILKESYSSIYKLAEILLSRPQLYIKIIGHTDNLGDKDLLKKLSQDRADAIKTTLIDKGVHPSRIDTEGMGDGKPLAPNDTEENKSKNRRVEIKIISQ